MARSKRIVLSIASIFISLLVGLLIAEAIVRIFELAPPLTNQYRNNVADAYLPFKPRPLSVSSGRSTTDEFDYEYRHNSFGFRDSEHQYSKGEGVFRILGLGDSFTYGSGVGFEDTYLYRLEEMLNNRTGSHPTIEIIKAGIPRYFPEPERILLEKYGQNYAPDLILVGFLPNDVIDSYLGLEAVEVHESGYLRSRESKEIGALGLFLSNYSDVVRFVLKYYISYQLSMKYPTHFDDVYKKDGFHEKDWQTLEEEYRKIVEISKTINSHVVFVHIPQRGPWTDSHAYPPKRLARWAHDNSSGFIDVLPAMAHEAAENKSLYYEIDGHNTSDGYQVIAKTIYKHLLDSNLVP